MTGKKTRKPAVAGQFYPSSRKQLKEDISACFLSELGPGSLPSKKGKKHLFGAIAPHAGYQFSGPCAAWAYKEIAESALPDTYVIVGLSHMGLPSCASLLDWETPLGTAKNDTQFGKVLEKKGIPVNEDTHAAEHSIEVQVPFLQFAKPKARIAPVIASHDMDYRKIAQAITDAAKELKRKITIIASSDFTHYGPAYSYEPFAENVMQNMYALDKGAIDAIKKVNAKKFIAYVSKNQATICGQWPIAALVEAAAKAKAKARLLNYYTSGDIIHNYSNSVGYASIVFEK